MYIHDAKEILLAIHVGDFLVAASQDALDWVYKEVSKVYELKKKIISSAPEDAHETTYLNRKLKWNEANWMSYEGDEKHDVLLRDWRLVHCRAVSSTLTKKLEDKVGDGCKLSESEGRRVRRSIVRINFMSQDRLDLCCAARILSKHMSSPTDGTRHALIHVVKYLKGHARCVNKFYASIPDEDYKVTGYFDSDWANDIAGRKSCGGGVLLLARVPVTFWSKSQSNIALSSGEAELNSSVEAISETLGVINLWEELMKSQLHATVRVYTSACKGMLMRSGTGRVKHLSTKQLWMQSWRRSRFKSEKISHADNCADMFTHSLAEAEAARQLQIMEFVCLN